MNITEEQVAQAILDAYLSGVQEHQIAQSMGGFSHNWIAMANDYALKKTALLKEPTHD